MSQQKNEILEAAKRLRDMNTCFTLSRGYDYSVALESALKMQECAYIKAHPFSTSDFMHGPISLIEKKSTCLLFCPKGRFEKEFELLFYKLKDLGATVIVCSDDDNLMKNADIALKIPSPAHEMLSPLYFACVAQLFACGLSIAKGLNPDKPRNLKKVTITK